VLSSSQTRARFNRVRCAASCGSALFSGPFLITAGVLATTLGISQGAFAQTPATPTGFAVTGGTSQLTLTWNNTAGLTYNVYQWPVGSTEPSTPSFTGKTSPFTSTSLTNGTTYFFRVSGVNSSSVEGPKASYVSAVPVATPAGVIAKAGNGVVNLSWTASAGAFRYSVYRSTTSGTETLLASDISTVSYNDTAITNGTAYYYKVSAVRKDPGVIATTESTLSSEVSATPLAALPAAPASLAAVPGNAQVLLSWGAVSGATSYKVYRSLNATGGPYTLVTSPTTTNYTDTGAINGTSTNPRTYYYVVTAVTSAGESGYSNEAAAQPGTSGAAGATLYCVADSTAVSSQPTATYGYHNLMYAWNGASSTDVIYVKFDLSGVSGTVTGATLSIDGLSNGASATNVSVSPVADTTWTEATLNWNNRPALGASLAPPTSVTTTETYQNWNVTNYIRSEQLAGHTLVTLALTQDTVGSILANMRARESGTFPRLVLTTAGPTAPTSLTATGGLGQVSLSWTAVPGATSYSVKRATTTGGPYTTLTTGVTGTSYINTGLGDGTTYYYVVSATNSTGEGANSAQASATTSTVTAPRNLVATPGEQQVLLTWTSVAGQGYNVYRSTTSGSGYTKINTAAIVSPNAYLDNNLSNGTTYYYVVTFVNTSSVESSQSTQASSAPLVQDANWTITRPTTSSSPTPTTTTYTAAFGVADGASAVVSAAAMGSVSSVSTQAQASCSGTWTFTWTGTSWPTLYLIKHSSRRVYSATVNSGTGSASVVNTGGSTLVSVTYPTSAAFLFASPVVTSGADTTDLGKIIFSNAYSSHAAGPLAAPGTSGPAAGWSEQIQNINSDQTAYTSAWFQSHYSTPQSIVLTFTVPTTDVTGSVSLSNATTRGNSMAIANISDVYAGF
jgi:fibronectin type 3 domain-containing protein